MVPLVTTAAEVTGGTIMGDTYWYKYQGIINKRRTSGTFSVLEGSAMWAEQ